MHKKKKISLFICVFDHLISEIIYLENIDFEIFLFKWGYIIN
jgi:hypothetical protein